MTQCRWTINLFNQPLHCDAEEGHQPPHHSDTYGPRIHWTPNNYWITEPTHTTGEPT